MDRRFGCLASFVHVGRWPLDWLCGVYRKRMAMNIRRRDLLRGLAALRQPAKDRIHAFVPVPQRRRRATKFLHLR
jgi:hypothetical protein